LNEFGIGKIWRQPFPGPGLAIRIICAQLPFIDETFDETNEMLRKILAKKVEGLSTIAELRDEDFSEISATLLPIQTVGVQGDARTYSYVAALSGEKNWKKLFALAKAIPQVKLKLNLD
jgi:GMP synthase (glutamine-hydrolysing)